MMEGEHHEEMEELRGQDTEEDYEAGSKRRLFRFKPRFDVVLVREVIRSFPWAAGYGRTRSAWMHVAQRVQAELEDMGSLSFSKGAALDHAIVKRRVDMLLDAFRKNEMSGLRGSGTPEDFDMRNKLLAILLRVVDEQTTNKGAMREKRVLQALDEARTTLAELEGTGSLPPAFEHPQPVTLPSAPAASVVAAAATGAGIAPAVTPTSLMPIAPAPATTTVIRTTTTTPQQNGSNPNKRPLKTSPVSAAAQPATPTSAAAVAAALAPVTVKRQRVEQTDALTLEERKLRLEERRVEVEEQRLAWEKQRASQDVRERQALLEVLRTQGSLITELLANLRKQ